MIHNVDVVVQVPTRTIGVRHDKKVCTVHALGKLHTEVMHALDVLRIIHIELLRREILRVGVHLVATTNCRDLLSTRNKRLRFPHRARVPLSTCVLILILKTLITVPTRPVQRISNSGACIRRRLYVDRTHRLTSSPNNARTSARTASTSRRSSSLTAVPARTTWFRFTPTRRNCSTALACSGDGLGTAA